MMVRNDNNHRQPVGGLRGSRIFLSLSLSLSAELPFPPIYSVEEFV